MYGSASYGQLEYASSPTYATEPYLMIISETLALVETLTKVPLKTFREVITLHEVTSRAPIKTFVESLSLTDISRFIDKNGFVVGVWTKIDKDTGTTWTKVSKLI